ncbi:MAG: thioredoxin domain-containing protein [Sphingomonadales bacterium]|jgi:protein-disulfide isomerase
MRTLALLLLAASVAGPAIAAVPARPAPAAPADWSTRLAMTAQGGVLIGNPAAPVKLVEFGSLTCPHCRAFHAEGLPALKAQWLASGQVSYEYRPFSLNGIDLMAGLLVQCQAAGPAWALIDRIYERQELLVRPFMAIPEAERTRIQGLAPEAQGAAMAEAGKLPEFAAAAGIPRARYDACIAAPAGQDRLMAIRADAVQTHNLQGTPSFLINGKMQTDVYDWTSLKPLLAAAVAALPKRTK